MLGGAGGALTPEEGAEVLRRRDGGPGDELGARRASRSLALVLVLGFGWYERTHPSAKVLALVATLAALAALGRIAFAPLPNVKPTTDIVLLSGYVLGGAPGFAIGAIGALASNLVFGQGPWTPWQMVAWGGVGVLGAALGARESRGRLGRVPLALACVAGGLFFGAVMDFSTWVTFSGQQTTGPAARHRRRGRCRSTSPTPWATSSSASPSGPPSSARCERFRARMEVRWTAVAPTHPDPHLDAPHRSRCSSSRCWRSPAAAHAQTDAARRAHRRRLALPHRRGRLRRRRGRRRRGAARRRAPRSHAKPGAAPPACAAGCSTYARDAGSTASSILGLQAPGANARCAGRIGPAGAAATATGATAATGGSVFDQALAILATRALAAPPAARRRLRSLKRARGGGRLELHAQRLAP